MYGAWHFRSSKFESSIELARRRSEGAFGGTAGKSRLAQRDLRCRFNAPLTTLAYWLVIAAALQKLVIYPNATRG
jgi:hypothetical protein